MFNSRVAQIGEGEKKIEPKVRGRDPVVVGGYIERVGVVLSFKI